MSSSDLKSSSPITVLLYYKYTPIADPATFRDDHFALCVKLGLKGRVYISSEGINGTVAGPDQATTAYKKALGSLAGFSDIHWKEDGAEKIPFAKLKVKVRPFLTNFGKANNANPQKGGRHLSPSEWKEALDQNNDYILLDVRNQYEGEVGHFEGAIIPPYDSFSEFPRWVEDLKPHKDKKVLMYCTGGIRCEKFSAYMIQEGFHDVSQLSGGILNYLHTEGPSHWKGRCFVFDDRLSVAAEEDYTPLTKCAHCGKPEDRHINCSNMTCNKLFLICDDCAPKHAGACSEACQNSPGLRPFDFATFRIPFRKKGIVFTDLGLAESTRRARALQK